MTKYELTEIKAIAANAGDTEVQDAILIHLTNDEFHGGDCVLFGYSLDELETDEDIETALNNEYTSSCFAVENGIYTVE